MATEKNLWSEKRKQLHARSREFSVELGDISRLFQRIMLGGSDEQRAEVKAILADTKTKLTELVDRIDVERRG